MICLMYYTAIKSTFIPREFIFDGLHFVSFVVFHRICCSHRMVCYFNSTLTFFKLIQVCALPVVVLTVTREITNIMTHSSPLFHRPISIGIGWCCYCCWPFGKFYGFSFEHQSIKGFFEYSALQFGCFFFSLCFEFQFLSLFHSLARAVCVIVDLCLKVLF